MEEALFLDFTGLKCPLPRLQFEKALKLNPHRRAFEVLATDRMAQLDLAEVCALNDLELLIEEQGAAWRFFVRRG